MRAARIGGAGVGEILLTKLNLNLTETLSIVKRALPGWQQLNPGQRRRIFAVARIL
jgi:hypothetical protein